MPNRWTFQIKPIKELLDKYVGDGKGWIDPFAGKSKRTEITNDINPTLDTNFHLDALTFLQKFESESIGGVLFDPPYSYNQVQQVYSNYGKNLFADCIRGKQYLTKCREEISRIVKPLGYVICCGWNSEGIGKKRGFEILEVLLVPHGGSHNDTIVVVNRKIAEVVELEGMALPSKSISTKKKEQPMGGTCEYAGVCSYRNEDKTVCLNILVKTNQRGASYSKVLSYSKSTVTSPPILVK